MRPQLVGQSRQGFQCRAVQVESDLHGAAAFAFPGGRQVGLCVPELLVLILPVLPRRGSHIPAFATPVAATVPKVEELEVFLVLQSPIHRPALLIAATKKDAAAIRRPCDLHRGRDHLRSGGLLRRLGRSYGLGGSGHRRRGGHGFALLRSPWCQSFAPSILDFVLLFVFCLAFLLHLDGLRRGNLCHGRLSPILVFPLVLVVFVLLLLLVFPADLPSRLLGQLVLQLPLQALTLFAFSSSSFVLFAGVVLFFLVLLGFLILVITSLALLVFLLFLLLPTNFLPLLLLIFFFLYLLVLVLLSPLLVLFRLLVLLVFLVLSPRGVPQALLRGLLRVSGNGGSG
mmetsp:Transcript_1167/g.1984  ORF Transcript_1167/g.1984 Transcript_1167/m.1984 type:complete len:342 (-) Transcript_1167:76-1101(-)